LSTAWAYNGTNKLRMRTSLVMGFLPVASNTEGITLILLELEGD
jgi:hypothetical protein